MVALATGAEADDAIQTLDVAGADDRFSYGEVTAVYDHNGYLLTANEDGTYPATPGRGYKSVMVTPYGESEAVEGKIKFSDDAIAEGDKATDAKFTYDSAAAPSNPGTYFAKVSGNGGAVYIKVTVAQKSLEGVYAYDNGDKEDTTFNFNFDNQKDYIDFAVGSEDLDDMVTVSWYKDGKLLTDSDEIRNAGTYVAQVKGNSGTEYAGAVAYVEVVVNKLDLASVDFTASDLKWTGDPIAVSEPTSSKYPNLKGGSNIEWELAGPLTSGLVIDKGDYTYTATVKADNEQAMNNLEGTATVSFSVRGTLVSASAFTYVDPSDETVKQVNSGTFMTADHPLVFDKSASDKDKQGFDADKFSVAKGTSDKYEQGVDYTLSYEKQNADGTWSSVSSCDEAGTYRVTAKMSADKDLSGSATAYFKVTNGTVASSNMFVTYKGEAVSGTQPIETTYDGSNVIDDIDVTVKLGDEVLTEGVDYKVEFTLDGKAVDEVVDADTNKMTITPVTYDGAAQDVTIKVDKVVIGNVRVATGNFDGLLYTGSEITPTIEYGTADNAFTNASGANPNYVSTVLPSELYSLTNYKYYNEGTKKWESVDSVIEPGDYKATFSMYGDVKNYKPGAGVNGKTVEFTVLDKLTGFKDVNSTDWFVGVVNDVNNRTWMNGLAGTELFAPNADITRADVACVLFNMASGDDEREKSAVFTDVEDYAYYTRAINWAGKVGVVNGHNGQYRPLDEINREEFASMLANYAKVYGLYEDASADLSSFADASTVSGWAAENVAWAVENGIMGNGGYLAGQDNITRAEVAAMVSNFAEAFGIE